ncbi:hypothetical protein TTHERM_00123730 (macronuclear) [Tetrahymena thermophila SB210]|uniref:Uncharacterized protein n=1 Tax=Tetrahymena thermophila (strain SB210) TaxID=312017 RepID=Q22YP8_TETTS|nr:hypothetical protein TTHERM_00123730 [Tetrahymena thermophila SB210]EAR90623.2 hypothetical protein TTHERM_00123730 [Tetrahymena thermophila SB210]|eukprot:XP_001010868.2 hypothetical protein TTHERM_00123730 [Tetrahymena thermophila SB210]
MFAKQLIEKACRSSRNCYLFNRNNIFNVNGKSLNSLQNQTRFYFGVKKDEPQLKNQKKKDQSAQNQVVDPVIMDYVLDQIQNTQDPEKLEKISKILDEIERRELERQKQIVQDLNTHAGVLSETDVYRAVQTILDTPEDKLIKSIQNNLPIDTNIWKKKIKKRIQTIPTYQVLRLLKTVFNLELNNIQGEFQVDLNNQQEQEIDYEEQQEIDEENQNDDTKERIPIEIKNMCNSIWNTVESEFTRRLKFMSIDEIARTVRLYAHANRSNPQFFREIENELFERDMEYVNYRSVGMILEGFSHANLGTTTLYANLARTIKVAQSEIHPLELAKYAYYFSKTPENIQGGFGIYKIAEEKLNYTIEMMEFNDLIKLSKYFIAQNIGSNQFLQKLEKKILDTYPSKQFGGISPNQLTKLVKNTSKHYFQYNDKALFHTLEAESIKQVPYMTVHQLQIILWSYSRSRRGNLELYEALEKAILKKLKLFNARGISFTYYQFAFANRGSTQLFQALEERILEIGIQNFYAHYLVKILSGINIRNALESLRDTLLMPILKHMSQIAVQSKYSEAIKFLYLLVELPPYQIKDQDNQTNINVQSEYDSLFKEFETNKFIHIADQLKIDEVSQLYFAYRSANIGSAQFIQLLEQRFEKQTEVPKPYFCRTLFSLVQHLKFDLANEFIPIVKELMKYGDIKYFFSHEDFIRLTWSLLLQEQALRSSGQLHHYDEERYFMKPNFWLEEVYDAMFSINPNTIKFTALPIWVQNICMLTQMKIKKMKKFQSKQKEELLHKLIEKVDQIDFEYKKQYVQRDLKQFSTTKKEIHQELSSRMAVFGDSLDYQLVEDLVDEFLNIMDSAVYLKHDDQILKIGVIILNEYHYTNRDVSNGQENLLLQVQNKITLLQELLDWQIIVIDEHQWNQYSEQEKKQYFFDNIQFDIESETDTSNNQKQES